VIRLETHETQALQTAEMARERGMRELTQGADLVRLAAELGEMSTHYGRAAVAILRRARGGAMNATDRLVKRIEDAPTVEAVHAIIDEYRAGRAKAKRAKGERLRSRPRSEPSRKEAKEAEALAFYEEAKRGAAARATETSNEHLGPRCELVAVVNGQEVRCPANGIDPDHILGGAMRKECERLGAEGLMCMCRYHHDAKHANTPTRAVWLDVAERHALRHGYRRLLSLISKARARYECKHVTPAKETP
jgi:hypothetical protein